MQIPNTLNDNENSKLEEILRRKKNSDLQIYVELNLNQLKNFD